MCVYAIFKKINTELMSEFLITASQLNDGAYFIKILTGFEKNYDVFMLKLKSYRKNLLLPNIHYHSKLIQNKTIYVDELQSTITITNLVGNEVNVTSSPKNCSIFIMRCHRFYSSRLCSRAKCVSILP